MMGADSRECEARVLELPSLMREAQAATGLNDWGDDDFIRPLSILLESLQCEAQLNPIGKARAGQYIMRCLTQRLGVIEDRKRHPEISAAQIDRPVFVTGVPRAGTTYLHRLLGIAGGMHSAPHWQLWRPSPPPNIGKVEPERTIEAVEAELDFQGLTTPEIKLIHFHGAREVEEDGSAFDYSFVSGQYTCYFDVPTYQREVMGGDYSPAYRWLRMVLQALQAGLNDCRWALKAPEHTLHMRNLFKEFPDARIIQHHRDPAKIMASVFSLFTAYHRLNSDRAAHLDPTGARHFMQMYAMGLEDLVVQRQDQAFNSRFVDIQYVDLEHDPIGCARRAYDLAGIPLSREGERTMKAWISENRKGKHGQHRYSLDDYGISSDEVREIFSNYINRFSVPLE